MFNNQEGSKNAASESLGVYSEAYKAAKTKKYGASLASKVNLYASGTLYGSVKQVKSANDTYVAVTDVKYPTGQSTVEVAGYLNKQYGEIFAPTKEEVKEIGKRLCIVSHCSPAWASLRFHLNRGRSHASSCFDCRILMNSSFKEMSSCSRLPDLT